MQNTVLALVKKQLESNGRVNLQGEVAAKFSLPVKFLVDRVLLDKEIFEYYCPDGNGARNKIENEVLISKASELQEKKANKEKLLKIDAPTSIETICDNLGLDQNTRNQEKVLNIIKDQNMGRIF